MNFYIRGEVVFLKALILLLPNKRNLRISLPEIINPPASMAIVVNVNVKKRLWLSGTGLTLFWLLLL